MPATIAKQDNNVSVERAYQAWLTLHDVEDCYTDREQFERELAKHSSPDALFIATEALILKELMDEPQCVIEVNLIQGSRSGAWAHLAHAVLLELAKSPQMFEALQYGYAEIQAEGCFYGAEKKDVETLFAPLRRINGSEEGWQQAA